MLVALLERAPADLWIPPKALCPMRQGMLLYATSKRVRALMRALGGDLPVMASLKGDYAFTAASTAAFLRGLRELPTFSSVTILMLERHVPNSIPTRTITSALLALDQVWDLEVFSVEGNSMRTPLAIATLSDFVARQHKIWSLNLARTDVGASLPAFCSTLACATTTRNLYLNSAKVRLKQGPAASALAQGMWFSSVFGNLRKLFLSDNNLASQMEALLSVMVGLTGLTHLMLQDVQFNDGDGQFFFEMLAGSALGEHKFAQEFATACPALEFLDMRSNQLHTGSFNALKDLLVARSNLKFVDMRGNRACAEGLCLMIDFILSDRVLLSRDTITIKEQTSTGTKSITTTANHGTLFVVIAREYNKRAPDQQPRRFFCCGQQVPDHAVVGMYDGLLGYGSEVEVFAML